MQRKSAPRTRESGLVPVSEGLALRPFLWPSSRHLSADTEDSMSLSVQGQPRSRPAPGPPPLPCRGLPGALGGEGCCLAWRLKVGQIGTKSKAKIKRKAHITTRGERTTSAPPTFATQAGADCSLRTPAVRGSDGESHGELGPRVPCQMLVWAHVCTRVSKGGAL